MGIEQLSCPTCGATFEMGLPRGATVKSVTTEAREEPDDDRAKVRPNACPNGHECYVMLRF